MVKQQLYKLFLGNPPIAISVHRLEQPLNRFSCILCIIKEHLNLLNCYKSTVINIEEIECIL